MDGKHKIWSQKGERFKLESWCKPSFYSSPSSSFPSLAYCGNYRETIVFRPPRIYSFIHWCSSLFSLSTYPWTFTWFFLLPVITVKTSLFYILLWKLVYISFKKYIAWITLWIYLIYQKLLIPWIFNFLINLWQIRF